MARRRYGGGNVGMRRDWVAATDGSTGEMREEDNEDSRRGGAEVTRRRRRRGLPPWRGVCCPESRGGNRSDILFILLVNLLSILLPFLCRRQRNLLRP